MSIYPNPATTQLIIHTTRLHPNETTTVSIVNILGETLPPSPLHVERGAASIDVSKLAAGIYFVQIVSESGRWVGRFVKQ